MALTDVCISSTSCLIRTNEVFIFSSIALTFVVISFWSFAIGFIVTSY